MTQERETLLTQNQLSLMPKMKKLMMLYQSQNPQIQDMQAKNLLKKELLCSQKRPVCMFQEQLKINSFLMNESINQVFLEILINQCKKIFDDNFLTRYFPITCRHIFICQTQQLIWVQRTRRSPERGNPCNPTSDFLLLS